MKRLFSEPQELIPCIYESPSGLSLTCILIDRGPSKFRERQSYLVVHWNQNVRKKPVFRISEAVRDVQEQKIFAASTNLGTQIGSGAVVMYIEPG